METCFCDFTLSKQQWNKHARNDHNKQYTTHFFSFVAFVLLSACCVFLRTSHKFSCRICTKFFSGTRPITSCCWSDFQNHKNIWKKKPCLIDCLKELVPVLHIMAFAVTHKPIHKTICAMNAFRTFLLQGRLFIPMLKPIFHLLILHDFTHDYISESHTSL